MVSVVLFSNFLQSFCDFSSHLRIEIDVINELKNLLIYLSGLQEVGGGEDGREKEERRRDVEGRRERGRKGGRGRDMKTDVEGRREGRVGREREGEGEAKGREEGLVSFLAPLEPASLLGLT